MKYVRGGRSDLGPDHDRLDGAPLRQSPERQRLSDALLDGAWHHDEVPYYGLDIETDTTVDGLDPARSAVVAVAVTAPFGEEVLTGDEAELLSSLDELVVQLPPGVIVTWNGSAFDLPFLAERARRCGVRLALRLEEDASLSGRRPGSLPGHPNPYRAAWGPHRHLDGYRLYRADVGRTLGLPCGLKPMARLVGLQPVEVDRTDIHSLGPEELHEYVASDARIARELVLRRMPAAARFADPFPAPSPDQLRAHHQGAAR